MKPFIEYIVKNLVADHESVNVQAIEKDSETIILEIRVATRDIGKVIGARGRTIKALRDIAMIIGMRFNRRVRLEIIE